MNETTYDKVYKTKEYIEELVDELFKDNIFKSPGPDWVSKVYSLDEYKFIFEIEQFIKENPVSSYRYLRVFFNEYRALHMELRRKVVKYLPTFYDEDIINEDMIDEIELEDSERLDFIDEIEQLSGTLDLIVEFFDDLPDEQGLPKQPQKFEKLGAIEKILIIHYLKIETLKRYQYHLKPGVFFLSRLLDINPESIKKPALKISDYTINQIDSESQARNLFPILEKVKSFFDNSDLNEISKEIETRIKELKRISGKD